MLVRLQQSDITAFTTCLKPLPFLLFLFAESISVIQRGSVNDSRAAAFRHGAVVARKGSLVMNQYVQLPLQTDLPFSYSDYCLSLTAFCGFRHAQLPGVHVQ